MSEEPRRSTRGDDSIPRPHSDDESLRRKTSPNHEIHESRKSVPEAWGKTRSKKQAQRDDNDEEKDPSEGKQWSTRKKIIVAAIVGGILIIAAIIAVIWWLHARHYEKTDDAFIDSHSQRVAPQVAGRIKSVLVNDNQRVPAGDVVIQIDPADYQVAVERAQASLAEAQGHVAQARAQSQVAQAGVEQAHADLQQAQVNEQNAKRELTRYEGLSREAVSPQHLDDLRAAAQNTQAQRIAADKKLAAAQAQVIFANSQIQVAQAAVKAAQGNLDQAKLNLSYTTVRATIAGRVTNLQADPGDYVTVGQQLLVLVPDEVWVTANYKETQLTHIRVGQPATITVDGFPGVEFHGHVDSIQKGSGSWFSVLPPENATGNYVKVVQRVPVKIVFDDTQSEAYRRLAPGMSVVPKIKVR